MSEPTSIRRRHTRSNSVGGPSGIRSFNEDDRNRLDTFMGCFDQAGQADVKAYIDKIYLDRFPKKTNLNLLTNACNDSDKVELGQKLKMIVAVPATTAVKPLWSEIAKLKKESMIKPAQPTEPTPVINIVDGGMTSSQ